MMIPSHISRSRGRLLVASSLAALLPEAALAQEAAAPSPPAAAAQTGGTRSYTPADFARFAPKTALDMLSQVPGFIIQQAGTQRGLGQNTANVLINGQRVSGKSNDVVTEISRVPARNVVRIDIVDGATLDVPGLTGEVANIIVKATGLRGQFSWKGEVRSRYTAPSLYNASASVSGTSGPIDYTIGIRNESFRKGGGGPATVRNGDRELIELRDDLVRNSFDGPKISGNFKYDAPGDAVGNLNLSYFRGYARGRELSERSGPGLVDRVRRFRNDRDESGYEVGADYEFGLAGGRLKLIGLRQTERVPVVSNVVTDFADETPSTGSRVIGTGDERETIGRAEYRWRSGVADWQLSAEGAFNSLDNVSSRFTLLPSGEYREIPFLGATAGVKEDRAEVMLTYGRPLSPELTLQASAGAEYSKLSQTVVVAEPRKFFRPKGYVSVGWRPDPKLDMSFRIERKVGQLNFGDFLASESLDRDNSNAGNPDLVPPQSWDFETKATRQLGAWGTASTRLYYRLISDIVDQIPIGASGEAPGNLKSATVYGGEFKGTLNLGPLGWRGAKVDFLMQLQNSRLDDPLTGLGRRISGDLIRNTEIFFRHDIPATSWAWGANYFDWHRAARVRLTEIFLDYDSPGWIQLYVENKNVLGLTVRAAFENPLGADNIRERTVFRGRRGNPIDAYEYRSLSLSNLFTLSISGQF